MSPGDLTQEATPVAPPLNTETAKTLEGFMLTGMGMGGSSPTSGPGQALS